MQYSKLAMSLEPSAIRAMMVKAAQWDDTVAFTAGEPGFLTNPEVLKAAAEALPKSTKYAPGAGFNELRDAYAEYSNKTVGTQFARENVVVTVGGMSSLFLSLNCLLNPGDEVLVSSPYFPNYDPMIRMNGGVPVPMEVTPEDEFLLTPELVASCITDKTKVILLNSPCNPTGGVLSRQTQEAIAQLCVEHDLFCLTDEVYRHLNYEDEELFTIATFPGMAERTLIIDSMSKSHAMTGFRVGFGAGPEELVRLMIQMTENVYSSVTSVSQYAAIEALKIDDEYQTWMKSEYRKQRDYLLERVDRIPEISYIQPRGAFYLFADISATGLTSQEFVDRLLEEKHVAVVPGTNFAKNAEGYIRMAYSIPLERIEEGMNRIEEFIASLRK